MGAAVSAKRCLTWIALTGALVVWGGFVQGCEALSSPASTFSDDFNGPAGPLNGRVSPTGQVWDDLNQTSALDGSGRLIRDPAATGGGSYGKVTLDAPVTSMDAEISFLGTSDNIGETSDCVLIYAAQDERDGTFPNLSVFRNFVHLVFSPWVFSANVYTDSAVVSGADHTFAYPEGRLRVDGTIYSVHVERHGSELTVVGPDSIDGTPVERTISYPLYETYAGKFLVFQTYDANWPALSPRIESVAASSEGSAATTATSIQVASAPVHKKRCKKKHSAKARKKCKKRAQQSGQGSG